MRCPATRRSAFRLVPRPAIVRRVALIIIVIVFSDENAGNTRGKILILLPLFHLFDGIKVIVDFAGITIFVIRQPTDCIAVRPIMPAIFCFHPHRRINVAQNVLVQRVGNAIMCDL